MSETITLTLTGSATIGDIQPLSDEGSQTFLLHGKKVKLLNKSGKKVKRIDIDGRRMYQKAENLPTADTKRVWVSGGQIIKGSATIGDMDGTEVTADTKRVWVSGGQIIKGSATIGDMDGTEVYGDTYRDNNAVTDYNAFIRYSDHALKITSATDLTGATNRVAVFDCTPNTKYTITMNMYSRFRVGSYAGVPATGTVLTTYQCSTLDLNDTTTQGGTAQSMTFTTGASDTKLFIGYWTTTDTVSPMMIRQSLKVEPYNYPTRLLLHGDTFTDNSHLATAVTNSGAVISTDQYKYTAYPSSYFLDNNNCLVMNSSNLFTGNTEFTLEAWVYPTVNANAKTVFSWGDSNRSLGDGGVVSISGTSIVYYASGTRISGTVTLNAWNHIAFVGNKTSMILFVNGVSQGSVNVNYSLASNADVKVGKNGNYSEYFTGYITEIRFSNIARWTTDFTPPTEPYSVTNE